MISGGGTGGHIYPAIAIAKAIEDKFEGRVEFLFIGANGKMEMDKIPREGYRIEGLTISGLQRKLTIANLWLPFKIIGSLLKVNRLIKRFKPKLVLGVGGYASGPTLFVAAKKGIPTAIQEQNSFPGITNRLLGKYVDKICVAYEGMDNYFPKEKIVYTGNPVRGTIANIDATKEEACRHFGLNPHKKVLLIIGGSLGARTMNQSIAQGLQELEDADIQVLWQCGKIYQEGAQEKGDQFSDQIQVEPFITRMDLAYAAADVIISRAGAIAISELSLVGKPAILVPSPNVAEDHQRMNARSLVDQGAAVMITDDEAREKLVQEARDLLANDKRQQELIDNMAKLKKPNAASLIADEMLPYLK
jgi:UDP-N-acetylglucosamine--N-acetylmuramyl-(pentapeptide) pyrophosphoryl-undecaprenol N-acetylglucosamine transferase